MNWIDLLLRTPLLLYTTSVLVGLIVGSFLNVVILRLPRMLQDAWANDCAELAGTAVPVDDPDRKPLSLSHPPSTCPHCGHRIRPHENIPLLSYLFLRGKCSACGAGIGLRYPLIEGLTGLLTLIVVLRFGLDWQTGPALVLSWSLIALAVIDLDSQLLPDNITLPMLWLGLLLSLLPVFADSHSAILGAVAGYLSLWSIFQLFRLVTGKEGMGYGDFKLLALLGAWLGWQALPQIVLLSAVTGAGVGLVLILSGQHARGAPMPFGPFLAAAGWIHLVWGSEISRAYLETFGL